MLSLQDEHSAPFGPHLARLVDAAEAWADEPTDGRRRPIEDADVRERLGRGGDRARGRPAAASGG